MKPYPRYRPSGVDWLGEVPEGWDAPQLKRFATMVYGDALASEVRDDEGSVPVYGSNGPVGWHNVGNAIGPAILIGRKGSFGALNWSECDCFAIDTVYFVDRTSTAQNLRWLYWAMHIARFDTLSQDTGVPGLSRSDAHETNLPLPPLAEQRGIARFLDREVGKIDALIAEQRQLIALLAEKRQATISTAVTRGLSPDTPLKPSGVEGLGDIPEGWEVVPLKVVASVQTGVAKGKTVDPEKLVEMPYLRVANVQDGYLDLNEVAMIEIEANQVERYLLQPGDVLMNEGGDFDKLGRGAIWNGEVSPCIHQNHVFAVRPSGVSSEWLSTVTSSDYAKFYFMSRSKQSTNLASISSTNLMCLPVVLPPISQQAEICNFIRKENEAFDALTATASEAIALLLERRAALISAAVTGKIDVQHLFQP